MLRDRQPNVPPVIGPPHHLPRPHGIHALRKRRVTVALVPVLVLILAAGVSLEPARGRPPGAPPRVLNVRHFGARGDGIADDRPAIQAALDAARPGDTVYFPVGSYRLTDRVTVRKSRVTLQGDGVGSILQHGGVNGLALGADGLPLTGLVVRRLKFVGQPGRYKADGNRSAAIQVFGPTGTLITDCDFVGSGNAIYDAGAVGTTYGTRIRNCRVHGWGECAVFFNGGEQIAGCRFIQDDPSRDGQRSSHAFYIHSGCRHVMITDTLIRNARKYAAQIYGRDVGAVTQDITFHNVTIQDCANGITLQQEQPSAARARDIRITGCTITGTYSGAALSIKQGDDIQILDNRIDGAPVGLQLGVWAPYERGFSISHLQASGNVIRHCGRGIWALASNGGHFTAVTLAGNTVTNCQKPIDLSGASGITLAR